MQKINIILLPLIAVFFAAASCTKNPPSPPPAFVDEFPDPKDSMLIAGIRYYKNYGNPNVNSTFESFFYDSKKRLSRVVTTIKTDFNLPVLERDTLDVIYSGTDTLVRGLKYKERFFYNDGVTLKYGYDSYFQFDYDSQNRIIADSTFSTSNNYKQTSKYTYITPTLIKCDGKTVTGTGTVGIGINYYILQYDAQGTLIRETDSSANTNYASTVVYNFDNSKNPFYRLLKLNYGFTPHKSPFQKGKFSLAHNFFKKNVAKTTLTLNSASGAAITNYLFSQYRADTYPLEIQFPFYTGIDFEWARFYYFTN